MVDPRKSLPLFLAGALFLGVVGCRREPEGPGEKFGKEVDKTLEKAGEQMEKAGER